MDPQDPEQGICLPPAMTGRGPGRTGYGHHGALHDFAGVRGCAVACRSDASYKAWQPESEKH